MSKETSKKQLHYRGSITDLVQLSEGDRAMSEIELLQTGEWEHPYYGKIEITTDRLRMFKDNFDRKVRKVQCAIDVEHKPENGAVGWIESLRVSDDGHHLYGAIDWTEEGKNLIKSKKYRYFSADFWDVYKDPKSGMEYSDVLVGGAITTRPFIQELEEVHLSELSKGYKFNSSHNKGGDKNMTLEELKAKMKADPNFKPEDGAVDAETLKKATEEIAAEKKAADDEEAKKKAQEEADAKAKAEAEAKERQMSEGRKVTLSENEVKQLRDQAALGEKAHKELAEMKMKETVSQFMFSETNKKGVLLPKSKDAVMALMRTLTESQNKLFSDFLGTLSTPEKLFSELGANTGANDEGAADTVHTRANKLLNEGKFKTYKDAAYEAEKQLKDEGKTDIY